MANKFTDAVHKLVLPGNGRDRMATKAVLTAMAWHTDNDKGVFWGSHNTFAREANCSRETVKDAVPKLIKLDLLVIIGTKATRNGPCNVYRMNLQAIQQMSHLAAPANPWTWDYVNTLTVRMTQGAPSSTSALNVLNGRNVAILHPSLEIIQFQNATLNGDGTYTLDTLLRGRRGTEWACGTAGQGERVLFPLIQGGLLHEQTALSLLNATRSYRGITLGADQNSTGVIQTVALKGRDLMPYAPCHITGSRDGSNNLLIQWQRRTRLGAKNIAGGILGLAEDTESYDVVIVDGSNNVLRTFANVVPNSGINWVSPAFPHVTYSAANQTADGLTPGNPVHVILYQNSAQVGRGFATPTTTI